MLAFLKASCVAPMKLGVALSHITPGIRWMPQPAFRLMKNDESASNGRLSSSRTYFAEIMEARVGIEPSSLL